MAAGCGAGSGAPSTVTVTVTGGSEAASEPQPPPTSSSSGAINLPATEALRRTLFRLVIRFKSRAEAATIHGPNPGTLYYGRYKGIQYAVADFTHDNGDDLHQAFYLKTPNGWDYVPDVGGKPTDVTFVPCPLRRVWGFTC